MIAYRFGHEDLLRTRFAISPLMELSGSVEAFRGRSASSSMTRGRAGRVSG